jgi:hypothetical protein
MSECYNFFGYGVCPYCGQAERVIIYKTIFNVCHEHRVRHLARCGGSCLKPECNGQKDVDMWRRIRDYAKPEFLPAPPRKRQNEHKREDLKNEGHRSGR